MGQLRHAVLLGAILSTTPEPIIKPFADQRAHADALMRFGGPAAKPGDKVEALLAQLAAFEWCAGGDGPRRGPIHCLRQP